MKNILITGGRSPGALELSRLFHQAGHRVVVIDSLSLHLCHFSNSVSKTYRVPKPRQNSSEYLKELLRIIKLENIDMVIPTYEESYYIARFKNDIEQFCPVFIDRLDKLNQLHNKATFSQLIIDLGLSSLRSQIINSTKQLLELENSIDEVVLKPAYSRYGENVLFLPKDKSKLAQIKILDQNPWVKQNFIKGVQYCTYALARNGKILTSSIYYGDFIAYNACVSFRSIKHEGILNWVKDFVEKTQFTGQIAFDFIVDENEEVHAIECNPRMTSGIHLYHDQKQLADLILGQIEFLETPGREGSAIMGLMVYGTGGLKLLKKENRKFISDAVDVIFRKYDPMPFFAQFIIFSYIVTLSIIKGVSTTAVTTLDIEWNGEDIVGGKA